MKMFVAFIIAAFVTSVYTQAPPAQTESFPTDLAVNATVDGKTCYFSKPLVLKNWQQSRELCEKYNTKLVTIDTAASNEQLMKIWKEAGSPRSTSWIDANDLENKDTFVWQSTKKPISWTNWAPSYPNTRTGNRRCVAAMFGLIHTGRWINFSCEGLLGFICCDK